MQTVHLSIDELKKLLSCGCPDAVALYLYRKSAQPLETALDALHFTVPQMVAATEALRQLGLWEPAQRSPLQPDRPTYTEDDVRSALRDDRLRFSKLVGEAQRRLGRTLSTEELKTILSLVDFLRLPTEVVGLLLSYCVERSHRRGVRAPSMRTIEREAYRWADEGIDSLEAASFFVQEQLRIHTHVQQLRQLLQIEQRRLTSAEEQYIISWITMGFTDEAIRLAYERTCLNTGALKWAYMNSILRSWHEKGLHTPDEIAHGDAPPAVTVGKGKPKMYATHDAPLTPLERKAVARALANAQEDPADGLQ